MGKSVHPVFLPKKSAERSCARLETTSSLWEKHSEISQCGRAGLERSFASSLKNVLTVSGTPPPR